MTIIKCEVCGLFKTAKRLNNSQQYCDSCIEAFEIIKRGSNDDNIACEPHAVLDATRVKAVEQIGETWVCRDCANAIKFMKQQEKAEIERELQICIRFGKIPF